MIQERKKDYLQRLIEEFFMHFDELLRANEDLSTSDKRDLLNRAFAFYADNFGVEYSDDANVLIDKIVSLELLEQYARLMLLKYEVVDIKDIVQLYVALDVVKYVNATDSVYSWSRTVLREDLLRILDDRNE